MDCDALVAVLLCTPSNEEGTFRTQKAMSLTPESLHGEVHRWQTLLYNTQLLLLFKYIALSIRQGELQQKELARCRVPSYLSAPSR